MRPPKNGLILKIERFMHIEKEIKSKIERDYFFIEGNLDIDSEYFINKIEEGVKDSSLSYKTNVKGHHTEWNFFLKDKNFATIVCKIVDCIEELDLINKRFRIREAWGLKEGFGDHTQLHDHAPSCISGTIYLNNHSQKLYFPDIKREVIPQCGKFVLFSSFLNHYTKRNSTDENKYAIAFNFHYDTIDVSKI